MLARCDPRRGTQRWRHNLTDPTKRDAKGPLWTRDNAGTEWCVTSASPGMFNVFRCDEVNANTTCEGVPGNHPGISPLPGTTCIQMQLCQHDSTLTVSRDGLRNCANWPYPDRCTPAVDNLSGRGNYSFGQWQHLGMGFDQGGLPSYTSGPVPHSRYTMITGSPGSAISFDPTALEGSTISPIASHIVDDDSIGNAKVRLGSDFCLDLVVGGNLEVWIAPLEGGRYAVGLLNRSPGAARITATWEMLGLNITREFDVLDVHSGKTLGTRVTRSVTVLTPSRGLNLLVLSTPLNGRTVEAGLPSVQQV